MTRVLDYCSALNRGYISEGAGFSPESQVPAVAGSSLYSALADLHTVLHIVWAHWGLCLTLYKNFAIV